MASPLDQTDRITALRDKALDGTLSQEDLDRVVAASDFDIALAGEHYLNASLDRQKELDDEILKLIDAIL